LRTREKNAARRLRMVVTSLAVHGGVLAFVVWMGLVTRTRVVEHADIGTLAGVEVAGGAHGVEIPLPARLTAADTNKPERYADAAVPPTLMMRQLRPQNDAGVARLLRRMRAKGEATRRMETEATTKMRALLFRCSRRSRP